MEDDTVWLDVEILEVGQITGPEDEKAVVVSMSFNDPDVIDASLVHKLRTRESVEEFIAALIAGADELWPKN